MSKIEEPKALTHACLLGLYANCLSEKYGLIQPASREFWAEIEKLTAGVEVNLDDPLMDD